MHHLDMTSFNRNQDVFTVTDLMDTNNVILDGRYVFTILLLLLHVYSLTVKSLFLLLSCLLKGYLRRSIPHKLGLDDQFVTLQFILGRVCSQIYERKEQPEARTRLEPATRARDTKKFRAHLVISHPRNRVNMLRESLTPENSHFNTQI